MYSEWLSVLYPINKRKPKGTRVCKWVQYRVCIIYRSNASNSCLITIVVIRIFESKAYKNTKIRAKSVSDLLIFIKHSLLFSTTAVATRSHFVFLCCLIFHIIPVKFNYSSSKFTPANNKMKDSGYGSIFSNIFDNKTTTTPSFPWANSRKMTIFTSYVQK